MNRRDRSNDTPTARFERRARGLGVVGFLLITCCGPVELFGPVDEPGDAAVSASDTGSSSDARGRGDTDARVGDDVARDAGGGVGPNSGSPRPPEIDRDPLSPLPKGSGQLQRLCGRGRANAVTRAFCGPTAPAVHSLGEIQGLLGLAFANPNGRNGQNGNPGFAISAHSSSLVVRGVSVMTPRAIVFTPALAARPDRNLVFMSYTRGDQFIEMAVRSEAGDLSFYLLAFEQACNASGNCRPGDLLTPKIDKDYTAWSLYDDEDLKNTTLDCLHCHQPQGPATARFLRMQELRRPWTHWLDNGTTGGQALLADFHAAHGNAEDYGPIPARMINLSSPQLLENILRDAGFGSQPNEFRTRTIEGEVQQSSGAQPATNVPPGRSTEWESVYARAVAGEMIPPPYHDVKVTDPAKLNRHTRAYQAFLSGKMTDSTLPDVRDTLLDSALRDMSIRPKAGLDGRGILVHMCAQCHNPRLDQSISRARFDVTKLDTMSREEKDIAIIRLSLPPEDRLAMPPHIMRELSLEERNVAIDALQ